MTETACFVVNEPTLFINGRLMLKFYNSNYEFPFVLTFRCLYIEKTADEFKETDLPSVSIPDQFEFSIVFQERIIEKRSEIYVIYIFVPLLWLINIPSGKTKM